MQYLRALPSLPFRPASLLRRQQIAAGGFVGLLTLTLSASVTGTAHAELIYGITEAATPSLVSFDSASPNVLTTIGSISGLVGGQTLNGIDFRPSNGLLYAVSSAGTAAQLYTLNLNTAALTTVGSGFTLTGSNPFISIDFNPVADALRVVSGNDQNYRVNANTGALIAQDTNLNPNSRYLGLAYSNNMVGAPSTTLYTYDYNNDNIGRIGGVGGSPSPNTGQYTSIGSSGVTANSAAVGFDISGATGTGYVSLNDTSSANANSEFYTVNLGTGALTLVGTSSTVLRDFSVSIPAAAPSAAAPEPGSIALLIVAVAPVVGIVRRCKKH